MDLTSLRELASWMRSEGAEYARVGELELRLGPRPPSSASVASSPSLPEAPSVSLTGDDDDERRSLEDLLFSSGVPVESVAAMMRRARTPKAA